jgi:hypothetical protein
VGDVDVDRTRLGCDDAKGETHKMMDFDDSIDDFTVAKNTY